MAADEIDATVQTLLDAHVKQMGAMLEQGYEKSLAMCDQQLEGIKRKAGQKSDMLDKALTNLGITDPREVIA